MKFKKCWDVSKSRFFVLHYAVYPIADYVVIALFLYGLALFLENKPFHGSFILGVSHGHPKGHLAFCGNCFFNLVNSQYKEWKGKMVDYCLFV